MKTKMILVFLIGMIGVSCAVAQKIDGQIISVHALDGQRPINQGKAMKIFGEAIDYLKIKGSPSTAKLYENLIMTGKFEPVDYIKDHNDKESRYILMVKDALVSETFEYEDYFYKVRGEIDGFTISIFFVKFLDQKTQPDYFTTEYFVFDNIKKGNTIGYFENHGISKVEFEKGFNSSSCAETEEISNFLTKLIQQYAKGISSLGELIDQQAYPADFFSVKFLLLASTYF